MATPPPENSRPGPGPRAHGDPAAATGGGQPVLRRARSAAGMGEVEGADAAFAAARLTALVHDLANLLDGSMRCLALAEREGEGGGTRLVERLRTVQGAMEQMAALVRGAMDGVAADAGLG